jgi:hypothetical protein
MIRQTKDLSPDQKHAIETLLGRSLSDDEQISIRAATPAPGGTLGGPRRHISDVIRDNMRDMPPEVAAMLPTDGASEHDHYLYGHPKRNQ